MHSEDEHFMMQAIAQARRALEQGELPIGAVIVLDGGVIAEAFTGEISLRRRLVHAELLALDAADRILPLSGRRRAAKLYTTLEPCMMCLGAAITFGISAVHYALESPTDGATALLGRKDAVPYATFFPAPAMSGGLLRQHSIELFETYCAQRPAGPLRDWAATLACL